MAGKKSDKVLNMTQRTVLQYLSLTDWKLVNRLPIAAGELILSRLAHLGWIEMRGDNQLTEVRLTPAGLKGDAVADWKAFRRLVELGLKAKSKG